MTDLAALSAAAKPMLAECVENRVWQIRLVFGHGDKACHAMRKWSDAYRTGNLVQIDREGMRERVKTALLAKRFSDGEHIIVRRGFCSSETIARDLADAAIAAILGGE